MMAGSIVFNLRLTFFFHLLHGSLWWLHKGLQWGSILLNELVTEAITLHALQSAIITIHFWLSGLHIILYRLQIVSNR